MKMISKIAVAIIATMTAATSMAGISASAYVYAPNEQIYDLYTNAPIIAPDVTTVTKQVYLPASKDRIEGYRHFYQGTPTTVRMSISYSLVMTGYPNYRDFNSAVYNDHIPLKSGWVSINDSQYISCECKLVNPQLAENFSCIMYVY